MEFLFVEFVKVKLAKGIFWDWVGFYFYLFYLFFSMYIVSCVCIITTINSISILPYFVL